MLLRYDLWKLAIGGMHIAVPFEILLEIHVHGDRILFFRAIPLETIRTPKTSC